MSQTMIAVQNKVVNRRGKWFVVSEDGEKNLGGPYDSKTEAVNRLRQIEFFKHNTFESITTNFSGMVRHAQMEDRDYLVVPMVMIVEGVLNGSNGAYLYPAEELSKYPEVWNHKPIVVYHPSMNGVGVSACDPDIISNRKVGIIMNTTFMNGKLKAEAWVEKSRIEKVDIRILEVMEANKMMELSTGLFTDVDPQEGEFAGTPYNGIARNYRPDHLALLPDQVGASSIADGAGFMRNSAEDIDYEAIGRGVVAMARGQGQGTGGPRQGDGGTATCTCPKCGATAKHERGTPCTELSCPKCGASMVGTTKNSLVKETNVDKEQMIADIIKNTGYTDEDKEFLTGLEDAQLQKMLPVKNEEPEPKKEKEPEPKKEEEKVVEENTTTENKKEKEVTAEQYIANAPEGIRDMLASGVRAHEEAKAKLVKVITDNKSNVFAEEYLKSQTLDQLKGIAALAAKPEEKTSPMFVGQGDAGPTGNAQVEEPLLVPTMNFDK